MREIAIGLLGAGNVGAGVLSILARTAPEIEGRLGARVQVRRALVRDLGKSRPPDVDPAILTTDPRAVIEDPQIQIVVELMGGIEPAREWVLAALEHGKHVVTANKLLLAERGDEIFRAATKAGMDVHYEAAVCGGIPIIRTLRESLASDRVLSIAGIVNGTTNYILTRMEEGLTQGEALLEAQRKGYAEADPTADIGGGDAAQKLCILASLAFGTRVRPADVYTEGIAGVDAVDVAYAREFGYVIRLLAVARRDPEGALETRVHPVFVPREDLLASVRGAFNAVRIVGEALGPALLYGQGAGAMPTGSAVVADVIETARALLQESSGRVPAMAFQEQFIAAGAFPRAPMDALRAEYYLRFTVADAPGVLAALAGALGHEGISIAQVVQRVRAGEAGAGVPVVMITHEARERDVRRALRAVDALEASRQPARLIRIEG
jgi:homoserine dehydrogenase